ncbi:MAG: hypothetical protein KJT01_17430 [Gemmatimonadetes bacterium]|nr:hypothetical protein [Gemmatimonadota bacterium]
MVPWSREGRMGGSVSEGRQWARLMVLAEVGGFVVPGSEDWGCYLNTLDAHAASLDTSLRPAA